MDLMTTLAGIPGIGPYVPYVLALIAIGAVVATVVPPPSATASTAYRLAYSLLQWCALNKGHATNANAPAAAPVPKASIGAIAALLLASGFLSACTPAGALTPQAQQAVAVGCMLDGQWQPLAASVAASLGPQGAVAAGADAALVHPLVVAACGKLGGVPAVVPVAAPVALNGVKQ